LVKSSEGLVQTVVDRKRADTVAAAAREGPKRPRNPPKQQLASNNWRAKQQLEDLRVSFPFVALWESTRQG